MNTKQTAEQNNVIQMPIGASEKQLYDAEQSIKQAKETKQEFCDDVLDFTMEQLINCLRSFGFFLDPDRSHKKDFVLLEQAVASILYRYHRLEHPLHEVIEELIQTSEEYEENQSEDSE